MRSDVAALYVDPRGPYPALVEHWYDEARDARTYPGPWPVVAHPPCGPWGSLRVRCLTSDRELAPLAVEQVRRFGGVLEHPRGSTLFSHCALPLPGELPDAWAGRTIEVEQVSWGHACRKPTWLYIVGVPVLRGVRRGGEPTHQIFGSRNGTNARKHGHRVDLKAAHAAMRRRTPVAFADWLLELASTSTLAKGLASPAPHDPREKATSPDRAIGPEKPRNATVDPERAVLAGCDAGGRS